MRPFIRLVSASAALVVAACGRQSTMDEQLKQDLDAASAATMELAPKGSATQVVSAIESKNPAVPHLTRVRKAPAPRRTPPSVLPQVTRASAEPAATRPSTVPAVSPAPPGGYKTIGEVLRNAPFPIKP